MHYYSTTLLLRGLMLLTVATVVNSIVNGISNVTEYHEYKFVAWITCLSISNRLGCTASVVSPLWLLTAGICTGDTNPRVYKAYAGINSKERLFLERDVEKIVMNPSVFKWVPDSKNSPPTDRRIVGLVKIKAPWDSPDVVPIKLSRKPLNDLFGPIQTVGFKTLPKVGTIKRVFKTNKPIDDEVVGFVADRMMEGRMCDEREISHAKMTFTPGYCCVTFLNPQHEQEICLDDKGSPAILLNTLFGVYSPKQIFDKCDKMGEGYVDIGFFFHWITTVTDIK